VPCYYATALLLAAELAQGFEWSNLPARNSASFLSRAMPVFASISQARATHLSSCPSHPSANDPRRVVTEYGAGLPKIGETLTLSGFRMPRVEIHKQAHQPVVCLA